MRRLTVLITSILWSLLIVFSLWIQREQLNRTAEALARNAAIANLKKDMAIRKWAASVDGVFVKEAKVQGIESLDEQERVSASRANGEPLKLVQLTPVHILLGIQKTHAKEYGVEERLTSLQLRNQGNTPDEWEKNALKSLASGANLISEKVPGKHGHGLMRVMIPMRMEKECLECHRDTLIPVGGLRGGASITIDLNSYLAAQEPAWRTIQYWHFGIWGLGLGTIFTFGLIARRREIEHAKQDDEQRQNELAFSSMAEGAVITDTSGNILWVNDAFCEISGYSREEILGKNPRILKSGKHDQSVYQEMWQRLLASGYWRGELWNRRKSGEVYPQEISIKSLRSADGKIQRFIAVFSDITERKRNEEAIQELNQSLEKRIQEEVAKNREKDGLLIQQSRLATMGEMMHNVAHQWRQPLNTLNLILANIKDEYQFGELTPESLNKMVADGNRIAQRMSDTIDDFRDLFHKDMDKERFELAEAVRQTLSLVGPSFHNDGIEIEVESGPPLYVLGFPREFSQVLLNVLVNAKEAIQQAGSNGRVSIRIEAVGSEGVVVVRDNGGGIPPDVLPKVFDPYFTTKESGSGIGLYMSRMLMGHMDCQIEARNTEGGAEFVITAPLAEQPANSHQ